MVGIFNRPFLEVGVSGVRLFYVLVCCSFYHRRPRLSRVESQRAAQWEVVSGGGRNVHAFASDGDIIRGQKEAREMIFDFGLSESAFRTGLEDELRRLGILEAGVNEKFAAAIAKVMEENQREMLRQLRSAGLSI